MLEHDLDAVVLANSCTEHALGGHPGAAGRQTCAERVHRRETMGEAVALVAGGRGQWQDYMYAENYAYMTFAGDGLSLPEGRDGEFRYAEGDTSTPFRGHQRSAFPPTFEHWRNWFRRPYYHPQHEPDHGTSPGCGPVKVNGFVNPVGPQTRHQ